MTKFQWELDEDERAEKIYGAPPWVRPLFILLPLLLAAALIYIWATSTVDTHETAIEASVRASQNLVAAAARSADLELYRNIVLRQDYNWARAQERLIERGLYLDRRPIGLTLSDASPEIAISLNPRQDRATVSATYFYTSPTGETIGLQHTAFFDLVADIRWMAAAPEADFWGEDVAFEGERLTLHVPTRDAAVARRLLSQIEREIAAACAAEPALICPSNLKLPITFAADGNIIATAWGAEANYYSGADPLILPTPTLVGLPVDSAAEQALARGYAAQIIAAQLTRQANYGCCGRSYLFQALLDFELDKLGLRPWPLTTADYQQFFTQPLPFHELRFAYSIGDYESARAWQAQMMAAFLARHNADIISQMKQLAADPTNWMRNAPINLNESEGQRAFLAFVYEQAGLAAAESIQLPEAPVEMVCYDKPLNAVWTEDFGAAVYTFYPAANRWERGESLGSRTAVDWHILPNGSRLFTELGLGRERHQRLEQRTGGVHREIPQPETAAPDAYYQISPVLDPRQQWQLIYKLRRSQSGIGETVAYGLLDVDGCQSGQCDLLDLSGYPVWSPDGAHVLVVKSYSPFDVFAPANLSVQLLRTTLQLQGRDGRPLRGLGLAIAPFWLDSERFGYVVTSPTSPADFEIRVASLSEEKDTILLGWDDLKGRIPSKYAPHTRYIHDIMVLPQAPEILLIAVAADALTAPPYTGETTLLFYDLQARRWLDSLAVVGEGWQYTWSPDGRWLLLTTTANYTYLLDTQTLAVVAQFRAADGFASGYSWSADSGWLLRQQAGFLAFYAPAEGVERVVLLPEGIDFCSGGGWIPQAK